MIIISTRIQYTKLLTEFCKMTERPATIDWKRMHKVATALEAYEQKHKGKPKGEKK